MTIKELAIEGYNAEKLSIIHQLGNLHIGNTGIVLRGILRDRLKEIDGKIAALAAATT